MSLVVRELTDAEIDQVLREKSRRKHAPEALALRRRIHLKKLYAQRHGHHLEASIAQTTLKLELLREIEQESLLSN